MAVSNLYLTRETAEALRTLWNEWALEVNTRDDHGVRQEDAQEFFRRLDALIDSLPVVGAVPAEEALEDLFSLALRGARAERVVEVHTKQTEALSNRANLRAAAVRHALRAAQAQADAPPPPDVIRRGHECLSRLHIRLTTGEYMVRDEQIEAVRAAMHPLPKEETP